MTQTDFENYCDAWLAAWTGNNPETLLTYYAHDAYYQDPHLRGGTSDRTTLTNYFAKLLSANPNWVWTREALWPNEKGFTLKWKAQIPLPDGETLTEYGMDVVELQGDKITRNEVYFDRANWLKALK